MKATAVIGWLLLAALIGGGIFMVLKQSEMARNSDAYNATLDSERIKREDAEQRDRVKDITQADRDCFEKVVQKYGKQDVPTRYTYECGKVPAEFR